MLIAAILGAALVQPPPEACPIIIAENMAILVFKTGSAELSETVRLTLDQWLEIAARRTYPTRFQLIGSADRVGSREANQRLAFRRADAVRRYLTAHGISRTLISVEADGEDRGLVETEDEVANSDNRSVQFLPIADEREPEGPPARLCPTGQPSAG